MSSHAREQQADWLDRYELLAEIASGGMATVYLGRLAGVGGFERLVAIKRLHPHLAREEGFIEMFLDEARIAARLHHPNVVSTLEVVASERAHYIVMDFVEGETLARVLSRAAAKGERLPIPIVLRILLEALEGMHAAHELCDDDGRPLGLVHRDVSPQNILVGIDGRTRLTDFGVAHANVRLASTRSGQLKGKFGYMSPEQVRGDPVDRRSDIFALGILMWEMLAGQRLFRMRGESEVELLHRVVYEDVPPPSSTGVAIPPDIDAICQRAVARNPSERFPDCAAFIESVEAAAMATLRSAGVRDVARIVDELVGSEVRKRREVVRSIGGTPGAALMGPSLPRLPSTDSGSVPRPASGVASVVATRHEMAAPIARPSPKSRAPWIAIGGFSLLFAVLAAGGLAWKAGILSNGSRLVTPPASAGAEPSLPLPDTTPTILEASAPPPASANFAVPAPSMSASGGPRMDAGARPLPTGMIRRVDGGSSRPPPTEEPLPPNPYR